MAKIIILGSSNAIPDERHENTHMVIVGKERTVLVDCVSNPILRLKQANVDFNSLTDLVVTHFHPDHVSGVPLLLMDMWLMGRKKPLSVYGLHQTVDRIENLMGFYDWQNWPNFFPIVFHRLPSGEHTPVMDCSEMHIFASPVQHLIPTIGLRVEFPESGKVFAYSCDTEPCDAVVKLANGADVLMHESTGAGVGHSSAAQAGEIAACAHAGSLVLIHYPTGANDPRRYVGEAQATFRGPVKLAEDFMELSFD